jgi:uncharacterized protein YndB with AHSA1/START domain
MSNSNTIDREIIITRVFDAPRNLVFQAFTDPKHVDHGKTKVTMRSVFPSAAELERVKGFGAVEVGYQTMERLADWLQDRCSFKL